MLFRSGAPDLPVVLANLGIPFDVALEVFVRPGNAHEKTLSAPILPVETEETTRQFSPDQLKLQDAYSTQSSLVEDAAIYKSAAPFPANQAALSQDAVVRQQRIVGVQLFPLQYKALADKLIIYESVFVEIRFLGEFAQKDKAEIGRAHV